MSHLAEERLRGLLDGTLPREEARLLAEHLAGECATCEEFLTSREGADAVDGVVDALLAASGRPGQPGNDLEFARIERQLAGRAPGRRRLVLGALAAAVLLAGAAGLLVARVPRRPGWDGEKGTVPIAAPVKLRFLVIEPGRGEPRIEKGIPGQAVAAEASLQFEIETARPADVAVFRVVPGGSPEVFFQERVAGGRTLLSVGGRPAAYSLRGAAGRQRFAVVAGQEHLPPARIAAASAALAPASRFAPDAPGLEGLSVDVVEVEVR